LEASLVYKVSSRTARTTQRNPVSKKKKKKKKKSRKKKPKKKKKKTTISNQHALFKMNKFYTRLKTLGQNPQ
jgi:hypothetical protein